MAHFYLTLPSNSSADYFPDNKITNFKTRLKDAISLNDAWEVGLSEVHIPTTFQNVNGKHGFRFRFIVDYEDDDDRNLETVNASTHEDFLTVTPGYYESVDGLVEELNILGRRYTFMNDLRPKFFYDTRSAHVRLVVPPKIEVNLTSKLARVLGLRQTYFYNNNAQDNLEFTSTEVCDLNDGIHSMYFYCDLLECVPVGDTSAPLLKIISLDGGLEKHGQVIYRYYEKPRYVPLQKKNFETLEIDIRDSFGEHIPFQSGTLIVTLHFRRVKENYFST